MATARFICSDNEIICQLGGETLKLSGVGTSSVRVQATRNPAFDPTLPSGLLDSLASPNDIEISVEEDAASLRNGPMRAIVSLVSGHLHPRLELKFEDADSGELLLAEEMPHIVYPDARQFTAEAGNLWRVETTFAARDDEAFYGLGQHQNGRFNQKGCVIDLVQMNTEVVIPFLISSGGYGVIWNNPGTGRVELASNRTRWVMDATPQLDYVVVAGKPRDILNEYARLTGFPPVMPYWATGFWQCKLRYATQDEVLAVAREYVRRGLPLSCLVIDFYNWTLGGEWKINLRDFPDPAAMLRELEDMGIMPMVSIWPTVNPNAENAEELRDRGYLITHRRGVEASTIFYDANSSGRVPLSFYDATNPEARDYHWARIWEGYGKYGFRSYWLDANEPEFYPTQPDNLRYHLGEARAVGGAYPLLHQRAYADNMNADGSDDGVLLSRSAWLGTQRLPVVVWSGDVHSSFPALARQIRAGLNMAMSGIPWWTTDIGGFSGGDIRDPAFHEVLVRWFQYGVFCPVCRLHGFRMDSEGNPSLGREFLVGGADNEVWSFGTEVEELLTACLRLRERLRPYIAAQMQISHETGMPPMRPLLLEFSDDPVAAGIDDQFLFGADLLIAPVLEAGARARAVYLPEGELWRDVWTGDLYEGGQWVHADAPITHIPVFLRGEKVMTGIFGE